MSDEDLIESLRLWNRDDAADRIEALVKERDEALEWLSASQGYIADAVFALDKQEKAEAKLAAMEAIATQWKSRAERLEAWIKQHGIHAEDCDTVTKQDEYDLDFDMETICTCSLTAILAALREGGEG